jgi:hypothetical protein
VARPVAKARAGLDARRRPAGRTAAAGPLRLARVSGGHAPAIRTAVPPGRHPETGRATGSPARPSEAPVPGEVLAPVVTLAPGGIPVPSGARASSATPDPDEVLAARGIPVPSGARASNATPVPDEVLAARGIPVPSGARASNATPVPGAALASSATPDPSKAPASGGRPGLPAIAGPGAAVRLAPAGRLPPAGRSVRALPAARPAGETVTVPPSAQAPGDPGMARTRARREARGTHRTVGAVPSARPEMPVRGCPTPSRPSSSTPRPGPS